MLQNQSCPEEDAGHFPVMTGQLARKRLGPVGERLPPWLEEVGCFWRERQNRRVSLAIFDGLEPDREDPPQRSQGSNLVRLPGGPFGWNRLGPDRQQTRGEVVIVAGHE